MSEEIKEKLSRRKALARISALAIGAYAAPSFTTLSVARASGASEESESSESSASEESASSVSEESTSSVSEESLASCSSSSEEPECQAPEG